MKKILALMLALMLCAVTFGALADEVQIPESSDSFDIHVTPPEGYTVNVSTMDYEISINSFVSDDEAKPELTLIIAFSEEYDGISLTKDMSDEQIKELYAVVDDSYSSDDYTVGTTDDGWKYLQIIDNEEENGYAALIMIHDGYFIETTVNFADYRPLVDADLEYGKKLLDSYVIEDIAK